MVGVVLSRNPNDPCWLDKSITGSSINNSRVQGAPNEIRSAFLM